MEKKKCVSDYELRNEIYLLRSSTLSLHQSDTANINHRNRLPTSCSLALGETLLLIIILYLSCLSDTSYMPLAPICDYYAENKLKSCLRILVWYRWTNTNMGWSKKLVLYFYLSFCEMCKGRKRYDCNGFNWHKSHFRRSWINKMKYFNNNNNVSQHMNECYEQQ